ncbi:hypothetical protein B0A48_06612 [Cryoendolithus antarcticus]|uniref:Calcineurin-like phosphoesterase domain-containing protein n=1 Tax=Cryoendolithus antarcticus TaxID=1507870 RepID=A0A1V8T987_9PEZI|nr:hypothetical protein B0A48_06612 [Cryoendolithus antarcticus]
MDYLLSCFRPPLESFNSPPILHTLLHQPVKSLLRLIHYGFSLLRPTPDALLGIRVVCLSDTHTLTPAHVPNGDILIHAGDLTNAGTVSELQAQIDWLATLPHKHKIAIGGNHDTYLDPRSRETLSAADQRPELDWKDIRYLQHASTTVKLPNNRSLEFYGAPQIPACGPASFAFQYPRGQDAWSDTVPISTDILITHAPPKYHLDLPVAMGCEHMLKETSRVKPLLHVFGHVHAGRSDAYGRMAGGQQVVRWDVAEEVMGRAMRRPDGLFSQVLSVGAWWDVMSLVHYDTKGLMWERVWGGKCPTTLMVNAALAYEDTGKLRNAVQVVDL